MESGLLRSYTIDEKGKEHIYMFGPENWLVTDNCKPETPCQLFIDAIEDWKLDFHCGNAVKYIGRHKHKGNPKEDIKKAIWYLQRYLETLDDDA
mgnify:CR=1 FL=1